MKGYQLVSEAIESCQMGMVFCVRSGGGGHNNVTSRTGYALRIAAFYGALFLYIGVYLPFFPVFLAGRGLSEAQIGIVMALPLVARIVATPMMTWLADRTGNAGRILAVYAWGVLVTTAVYLVCRDFATMAIVTVANAVFLNPMMPITEALALRGARLYALDYGRMRLAGSATFIAGNLVGGAVIAAYSSAAAVWLMIASAIAMVVCGFLLPATRGDGEGARMPMNLVATFRDAATPFNVLVLGGFALLMASHNLFYVFGTINWSRQGIGSEMAGVLWSVGVVAEICLFAFSGAAAARLGIRGLVLAACTAGLVRWSMMAFDPPLALLFPLQALHGLTFGALHLAAMGFLSDRSGAGSANSLQGLYFTITGVASSLVNLAAGPIYAQLGASGFLVMAVLVACGGALVLTALARGRPASTP